jgi:hypothetical protein
MRSNYCLQCQCSYQVAHELDERHATEAVVDGEGEGHPDWRQEEHGEEEDGDLPRGPVGQMRHPRLAEVLLHNRVCHHVLVLRFYQDVQQLHASRVYCLHTAITTILVQSLDWVIV